MLVRKEHMRATHPNTICVEKNGLFFIETSALDATNVDKAFETILSGTHCTFIHIQVHAHVHPERTILLRALQDH